MQPDQYVQLTAQAMQADGSQVSSLSLPGGYALVGYQSQFKIRWMATKVHLFTVVAATPLATPQAVRALTRDALDHAKRTKGSLRGIQTGVAVIPALVAAQVTPEARAEVQRSPKREFAAINLPAIVDLSTGEVISYQKTPAIGGIYFPWLRKRRDAVLPPPSSFAHVAPPAGAAAAPAPPPSAPPAPGTAWPPRTNPAEAAPGAGATWRPPPETPDEPSLRPD